MQTSTETVALWRKEYEVSGIPSSFRGDPSGAVVDFVAFLGEVNHGTAVVDLGCGRGRNSIYLASRGFSLDSVDLVQENIDGLNEHARELGLEDHVNAKVVDLGARWPFEDNAFDIAVDTFVYKHQTAPGAAAHYRDELARVVRRGGYLLLTLAGTDDGYYSQFVEGSSGYDRGCYIVDPGNGISSILYDREDVEELFSPAFDIHTWHNKIKDGEMHGAVYRRSTHVFFMQRV